MRLRRSRVFTALGNPQKWDGNPIDSDEGRAGHMRRQGLGGLWLIA
jgi:hypothetical protein